MLKYYAALLSLSLSPPPPSLPIFPTGLTPHSSSLSFSSSSINGLKPAGRRLSGSSLLHSRRRVIYDDDNEEDEEYGYNAEIAMLEVYSQSVKDEALLVKAVVDEEEVEVIIFKMQSSVSSCSPVNSESSPEYVGQGMDYDNYIQMMEGEDPYAPGYAPEAPTNPDTPMAPSAPFVSCPVMDEVQAAYGFYPIEPLDGSDPLEFIVHYPYPWDPSPRDVWEEWSMVITTSRFLDHITWYEGEWHLVWGEFTGPVYRMLA